MSDKWFFYRTILKFSSFFHSRSKREKLPWFCFRSCHIFLIKRPNYDIAAAEWCTAHCFVFHSFRLVFAKHTPFDRYLWFFKQTKNHLGTIYISGFEQFRTCKWLRLRFGTWSEYSFESIELLTNQSITRMELVEMEVITSST